MFQPWFMEIHSFVQRPLKVSFTSDDSSDLLCAGKYGYPWKCHIFMEAGVGNTFTSLSGVVNKSAKIIISAIH